MRTTPQCIITGCALVVADQDKAVHGDLHFIAGSAFIFNAVTDHRGERSRDYGRGS